jgi:hypothetical protein
MSELAFDEDGQHFQVPVTVTRWRIRRFNNPGRPGGAQVVYGDDGLPLFLDVDTTAEEFRDTVGGVPGRYRLDGADAHARIVDGVPPAYLMINGPTTASGGAGYGGAGYGGAGYGGAGHSGPPANSATEYALVEMARVNGEAFKVVADKFGNICDALSNVVRAVDAAGLPRRAPLGPLLVDHVDQGDDEDDEDERNAAPPQTPQATIATVLGQVMQMVQVFTQMNGGNPAKLGAVMGQVVETARVMEAVGTTASSPAAPTATGEPSNEGDDVRAATSAKANTVHGTHVANGTHATHAPHAPHAPHGAQRGPAKTRPSGESGMSPTTASAPSSAPTADPMAQFQQIMAALTLEEQAKVQYVITTLSVRDLMQWYEQLAGMSVADGVAKIRAELARVPPKELAA